MYNNGSNNSNRRNNNQRRNNKSRNGKSNGSSRRNYDDENITPQQKRHFMNKRETHMNRGKELRAAGDRVEAENEFQHAEHYTRMIKIADEQQAKYNERKAAERPQNSGDNYSENFEADENFEAQNSADAAEETAGENNPETAPEAKAQKPKRERNFKKPERAERAEAPTQVAVERDASSIEDAVAEIAQLSFMKPIAADASGTTA